MSAKGADDISEIPAIRRFREGPRFCAKSAKGMYPDGPEVGGGGIVDRSVTLSRKPTQPNRDGGSGCYPPFGGENLWWFGGKCGGPSTEGLWQVVGRGFSGTAEW